MRGKVASLKFVGSTLALVMGLASAALIGVPAHAGGICADYLVIGARGSGESVDETDPYTGGLGLPVKAWFARFVTRFPSTADIAVTSVDYPAVPVNDFVDTFPDSHTELTASINEGARQLIAQLREADANCRGIEFVLAGYSQGAMVIHQALARMYKPKNRDENRRVLEQISAVALIADGDRPWLTQAKRHGDAPRNAEGIRHYFQGGADTPIPDRTWDVCMKGDLVCDFAPTHFLTEEQRTAATAVHELSYLAGSVAATVTADAMAVAAKEVNVRYKSNGRHHYRVRVTPPFSCRGDASRVRGVIESWPKGRPNRGETRRFKVATNPLPWDSSRAGWRYVTDVAKYPIRDTVVEARGRCVNGDGTTTPYSAKRFTIARS